MSKNTKTRMTKASAQDRSRASSLLPKSVVTESFMREAVNALTVLGGDQEQELRQFAKNRRDLQRLTKGAAGAVAVKVTMDNRLLRLAVHLDNYFSSTKVSVMKKPLSRFVNTVMEAKKQGIAAVSRPRICQPADKDAEKVAQGHS